jgi:hypothetical protein
VRECSSTPENFRAASSCGGKDLVYSILMDTIKVLRERVENAAITICNNRGMLKRVEESFCHFEHFM